MKLSRLTIPADTKIHLPGWHGETLRTSDLLTAIGTLEVDAVVFFGSSARFAFRPIQRSFLFWSWTGAERILANDIDCLFICESQPEQRRRSSAHFMITIYYDYGSDEVARDKNELNILMMPAATFAARLANHDETACAIAKEGIPLGATPEWAKSGKRFKLTRRGYVIEEAA